MNVGLKLASFAVALVVTFAAAYGVGSAVGPVGDDAPPAVTSTTTTMVEHGGHS